MKLGRSHIGKDSHADQLRSKARSYYGVESYHSRYQELYQDQPWQRGSSGLSSGLLGKEINVIQAGQASVSRGSSSAPNWEKYRSAHQGERCFIIGNGPSLRAEDLQVLHENKEWCFGSNKIWKVFPNTDWRPNFYGVDCSGIVAYNQEEIAALPSSTQIFAGHYLVQKMPEPGRVLWMIKTPMVKPPEKPEFSMDASKVVNGGGTITYSHMQLAAFMGFSEIYLLGVDFSYNIEGSKAHPYIKGHGTYKPTDKENYFVEDYFKPGEIPLTPTLDESYQGYLVAKEVGPARGFTIYNATRGGKLDVFPRVDFDALFN